MIRQLKTHASLAALAAAIYSAGSPAYAQEDPPRTASVEEVVVSAQRREQRLQDVPIAVTALSADQLETRGVGELNNISREIPNIQFMPAPGNGASTAVFARGAEAANPGFNTSESPIGFYQDDVYRGRLSTANFDFADIERVEALRGPQATLYGRNTLSGAVKLYSRTPRNDGWLKGSVGVGNWETLKGSFSAGGPLIQDQLGASFAVVVNRQGKGYFVDETGLGRNIGNSDNLSARGKLHWFGSDTAALTLSLEYSKGKNDGFNGIAHFPNNQFAPPFPTQAQLVAAPRVPKDFYGVVSPFNAFGKFTQRAASVDFTYDLTDSVTFRSISGFWNGDDDTALDFSAGLFNGAGAPIGQGTVNHATGPAKQYTQEFQLLGDALDGRLNWLTGLFYIREQGHQDFVFFVPGTSQFAAPSFMEQQANKTDSYSVFGQASYEVTEGLSLTAGARATKDEKQYTDVCTNFAGASGFSQCRSDVGLPIARWAENQNRTFKNTDWKLGVDYKVNPGLLIYGSAATGFKAGGFQALCFGGQACVRQSYQPQTVVSYEGGFKSTLADGRLRFNAAAYLARYDDVQSQIRLAFGNIQDNIGELDVSGVEVEANLQATDDLTLFATLATAKGDYGAIDPTSVVALTGA